MQPTHQPSLTKICSPKWIIFPGRVKHVWNHHLETALLGVWWRFTTHSFLGGGRLNKVWEVHVLCTNITLNGGLTQPITLARMVTGGWWLYLDNHGPNIPRLLACCCCCCRCWCWDWRGAGGGRSAHLRPSRQDCRRLIIPWPVWLRATQTNKKISKVCESSLVYLGCGPSQFFLLLRKNLNPSFSPLARQQSSSQLRHPLRIRSCTKQNSKSWESTPLQCQHCQEIGLGLRDS